MNRLLTLASTGLFAAGLAILPVSVYAQPNAAATGTTSGTTTSGPAASTDMKTTAPVVGQGAKAAPAVKGAAGKDVPKDRTSSRDAGKTHATKSAPAKVGG